MSPEEVEVNDGTVAPPADLKKEEFVGFLTSTGRIRGAVASSLYDAGLNDYHLLETGDEKFFMSFSGVGERTADALMELGARHRSMSSPEPPLTFEEAMAQGKVRSNVVKLLKENGLDSFERILSAGEEGLTSIKGIGPATASAVLGIANKMADVEGPRTAAIEDASAIPAPEGDRDVIESAPERKANLLDRIASFFRGMFRSSSKPVDEAVRTDRPSSAPPSEIEQDDPGEAPLGEGPEAPGVGDKEQLDEPALASGGPLIEVEEKVEDSSGAASGEEQPPILAEVETPLEDALHPSGEGMPDGDETSEDAPAGEVKDEVPEHGTDGAPPEGSSSAPAVKPGLLERILSVFRKRPAPPTEKGPEPEAKTVSAPADAGPQEGTRDGASEPAVEETVDTEGAKEEPASADEHLEEGTPKVEPEVSEIREIADIPGLSEGVVQLLNDAGYLNIDELKEAVWEDLILVEGIDEPTAKAISKALHPER